MNAMHPPAAGDGSAAPPTTVVAVLTCFNRKPLTLACLKALEVAARQAQVQLQAIVVDDASSDGTAAAIRAAHPWVELVEGSGSLYWNRGMHQGFARALERHADFYLWLNDDTELLPSALQSLLRQSAQLHGEHGQSCIVVGATAERGGARVTYGGRVARSRLRRFSYDIVWSDSHPVPCEAIEGNCVLIAGEIAQRVGNLDPAFEHAMGDTDYGLRARRLGVRSFVAAGIVGHCSINPVVGSYFDESLPLRTRWRLLRSRKGLPVRSWLRFTVRHGGPLWPLYFSWPYVRVVWSGLRAGMSRRVGS